MVQTQLSPTSQVLDDTVRRICESYFDEELALNHLRENNLPSRQDTLQVLAGIKDLLFPDHRLAQRVRSGQTSFIVGGILERVHAELRRQVLWARSYDYSGEGHCPYDLAQADADVLAFIARLPALRRLLALDALAALEGDPAAKSADEIIFCYPGFEAVATYRIAHELHCLGVPLLPRIMTEDAHSRTGADIHPGATIAPSFFIDHATGVVIGETTIIGERVILYQGVTLGALRTIVHDAQGHLIRNLKRHPTIEDDVVIYAGATVLGGDTVIGAGSVIGGSCWITHSIPPGTKVRLQEPQMHYRGPRAHELDPPEPEWVI